MSKNGLHRHYDRLDAQERFRLDVLAMARGDAAESERLVGSCPKLSYRMNDWAFVGRWMGAIDITLRVRVPLEGLLSRLRMIEGFRQIVPYAQTLSRSVAAESYFIGHHLGSIQARGEAGRTGRPSAWPAPDTEKPEGADEDSAVKRDMEELDWKVDKYGELLPEIMDRLERELAQEALDLWAGFEAFCAEGMGVGAKKIMAATLQDVPEAVAPIEELEAVVARLGLEPDTGSVEEARDKLLEAWRVVEERGT
jgi:hypothetical protein